MYALVKYEDDDIFYNAGYELMQEEEWNLIKKQMDVYFQENDIFHLHLGNNQYIEYVSVDQLMSKLTIEYIREDELEDTFRYLPQKFGHYFPFELFWEC